MHVSPRSMPTSVVLVSHALPNSSDATKEVTKIARSRPTILDIDNAKRTQILVFLVSERKIAQLTALPEWLSQLGIRDENLENMATSKSKGRDATSPSEPRQAEDYDDDTLSYRSIVLEECSPQASHDLDALDNWDFTNSFLADIDSGHSWNDTIQRQHFGPLSDLLTSGGESKAKTHSFQPVNLLHPTWCDKCGDFIWGILKQAIKCQNCNYTCHERCRELVTLDCRSAGSSLASGEFASLYPPLPDGTLGTIPKGLILPNSPSRSNTDSDKENGSVPPPVHHAENPLFSPTKQFNSFTLPKSFAPLDSPNDDHVPKFVQAPSGTTLRVVERYVKEDTPFEWTPEYKVQDLVSTIDAYNANARGFEITLLEDGETYHGHLQIHMNFARPISVVQGEKPPTVYDVVNTGRSTFPRGPKLAPVSMRQTRARFTR
ncbi:unnamed protein product [Caenorhabditis auriculariae]|uniref:Phorbol-ester/DAG-type domain-containing protein n=1 Tax=Caenorhabditis auriculariae TaxID=2777116 RepID=A0A8S1HX58_9PELO|nr:unnamed protein product [Caenorhabditis auriculariae]